MENKTYVVYGLIEPYSKNIVYIDLYTLNEDTYPKNDEYIDYSIRTMQDTCNVYWRDLHNMNNMYPYGSNDKISVVILDKWKYRDETYEEYAWDKIVYWRKLFKPRYNTLDECEYSSKYIECEYGCEDIRF